MVTGIALFALVLLMAVLGVPIGFAFGVGGMIAAWVFYGGIDGAYLAGISAWTSVYSWSLLTLPLFILMGLFAAVCNIGKDAFDSINMWLSKARGGLALVATLASALFGAVTGSTTATIATIGSISLPEMQRLGYSAPLRTGAVACAGILANLIPPSIFAIIYCGITQTSLGQVFIAGLVPGIILTLFFGLTIYIWAQLRPDIAPISPETFTLRQKISSLRYPLPIVLIFVLVIGGIYTAIFTPTESASIGSALMLITVLVMRRLNLSRFQEAVIRTVQITAYIMLAVVGGKLFLNTLSLTEFPSSISGFILGLGLTGIPLMFSIIFLLIILGMFLDPIAMLIMIVPLFLPSIQAAGFSPVWLGTMTVMLCEIACITPPIAANIYLAQLVDGKSSVADVVKGVLPFYVASLLLVVLLVFSPQIALWLPSTMYGG